MSAVLPPPAPPAWHRPGDERLARAAWSRLAEPNDRVASALIHRVGAAAALGALLTGQEFPEPDLSTGTDGSDARRPGPRDRARWRIRLADTDPRRDLATLERLGGRLLIPGESGWPTVLDDLGERRPVALWARGPIDAAGLGRRSVALVGSRAGTGYGEEVALDLGAGCADRAVAVISGAAYGVDAAAHRGALTAGGVTVAVLACGVDRIYPQGHEQLLRRIGETGLVVSEVPPGSAPLRSRFLERNRLIAALAGATVVVEAAQRSGTASTARHALDLGRPLGAVPGPVTSMTSTGCHDLIRDGAVCVTRTEEVLELLGGFGALAEPADEGYLSDHDGLGEVEVRVLDALPLRQARPPERVAAVAGLPVTVVAGVLARLELAGLASVSPTGDWRRDGARGDGADHRREQARRRRSVR